MFVIDWAFSSPLTYRKYGTREEANPLAKIIPCFYNDEKKTDFILYEVCLQSDAYAQAGLFL